MAIHIQGGVDLKMTDFGIDPPRAIFGTLRTDDEIRIVFELNLKKRKQAD